MAKSKPMAQRKRRTRQHVIADLAVNHVERHILLCGYSAERVEYDYGGDLSMYTYDEQGQAENGRVLFQVKATDRLMVLKAHGSISYPLDGKDLDLWLRIPS